MNILATQFTLKYNAFEIYTAGCNGNPHCQGCHNPESWSFNQGDKYNIDFFKSIENKVKRFDNIIKNIMIFGGEPLDNPVEEFVSMINDLKILNKDIWLFTRYDLDEVKNILKDNIFKIDYIKCGRYIPSLTTENNEYYGINLATSNQKIYKKGLDY